MQGEIEAGALVLLAHTQRGEQIDRLEQHEGHDAGPGERYAAPVELNQDLIAVALHQARGFTDSGFGADAVQQRTGRASDAVYAEHVERVIVAELGLELVT